MSIDPPKLPVYPFIPAQIQPYIPFIQNVLTALVILVVGWIVAKWANKLMRRVLGSKVDAALANFLSNMAQYSVVIITVLTAIDTVGIQTTSISVVFGGIAIGVGAAFQGTLGSFASGVLILFFRPFDLGQKVSIAGQVGVVEDIGLFATTMLTADNETIIVPNGEITKGPIVNFSAKGTLRGNVVIDLKYGLESPKMVELLVEAAKGVDGVLDDPAPSVAFGNVGPRGLSFTVFFWAKTAAFPGIVGDVRHAIYGAVQKAEIEVPQTQIVIAAN